MESWLLDICQIESIDVEPWLLKLLGGSNNVAVTAVVTSVCNAHPEIGGRAALAVLSSPELLNLDCMRMTRDMHHPDLPNLFPFSDPVKKGYKEERQKSD